MRLQLHEDKPVLERLLTQYSVRWAQTMKPHSLAAIEQLHRAHEQLKNYSYIESIPLLLSDEREVQEKYGAVMQQLRFQLAEGVETLAKQAPLNESALHLYSRVRHIKRNDDLEAQLHASPVRSSTTQLQHCKRELGVFFAQEHYISDRSFAAQCTRALATIREVKVLSYNDALATEAVAIAKYSRVQALQLRDKIVNYFVITGNQHNEEEIIHTEKLILQLIAAADEIKRQVPQQLHELLIGAHEVYLRDSFASILKPYGDVESFTHIPYLWLRTDEEQAKELLLRPRALLRNNAAVIYAPHDYFISVVQERMHTSTWNLELVHAPASWEKSKGEGVRVAVIDTGIDYRHKDLAGRFEKDRGVDFVNNRDPFDDNGHGTHVAGTVAGSSTGVAPAATLYAVKVLDEQGSGSEVAVLRGLEWAISKQVDVVNLSLGSAYSSKAEEELIRICAARKISVACAAGNDGSSRYNYPASCDNAISVAAVDRNKNHAQFSNYNDMVDLAAPGVAIYSTWPNNKYNVLSGTSMATPHVAGATALVRLLDGKTPESILKETAEKLGRKDYYGSGLINCEEAVKL
jgi:subtilisin